MTTNKQDDNFYNQQDTRIAIKRVQRLLECELNIFELNHAEPETIADLDLICAELASYFPYSAATLKRGMRQILNREMKKCTRFLAFVENMLAVSTEHDMLLALKNLQKELDRYLAAIVENLLAAQRAERLYHTSSQKFAEVELAIVERVETPRTHEQADDRDFSNFTL